MEPGCNVPVPPARCSYNGGALLHSANPTGSSRLIKAVVLFVPSSFVTARTSRVRDAIQDYCNAINRSIEYCVPAPVGDDSNLDGIATCIAEHIPFEGGPDVRSLFVGVFLPHLCGDALQDGGVATTSVPMVNLQVYVVPPRSLVH